MTDDSPTSPDGPETPASPGRAETTSPSRAETATSPSHPEPPEFPADAESPRPARRRRNRLIVAGVAGAAVLIVLVCAGFGAVAAGFTRLVRDSDQGQEARGRVETACLALEKRLNRLAPPGAARTPGERAAAIRDENAAVAPFIAEIEAVPDWRPNDDEDEDDERDATGPGGRRGWTERWRDLVTARRGYADALDRQVTNGEPAFFIAPQDAAGRPVAQRLERDAESCAGAVRRLAAPDL